MFFSIHYFNVLNVSLASGHESDSCKLRYSKYPHASTESGRELLTDILADAVGGWRSSGRRVAADVAIWKSLSGVDDARRTARHWRQTTADTGTNKTQIMYSSLPGDALLHRPDGGTRCTVTSATLTVDPGSVSQQFSNGAL